MTSPARTIPYGSGTATIRDVRLFNNEYGYDVDRLTVVGLNVNLAAATYWLTLQDAVTDQDSPLFWDVNNGVGCPSPGCPSSAKENILGQIPSESFTIFSTPEPASLALFGSCVVGLAGMLRHGLMIADRYYKIRLDLPRPPNVCCHPHNVCCHTNANGSHSRYLLIG